MNGRPPHLSPFRLLAGLVVPLGAYLLIRAAIGSATGALAITEAVPAAWLLIVGIARRRLDPVARGRANRQAQPRTPARDPASLAEPERRRAVTILTAIIGLTFAIDGASQTALALTVPTRAFVADSTAVRIIVIGTGMIVTTWSFRHQKERRERRRRSPAGYEHHE